MKINTTSSVPANTQSRAVTPDVAKPSTEKKAPRPTDTAQKRISGWFTQVGISPNAVLGNYNERSAATRRHQDIRKVKRAENLRAIMTLAMDVAVGDVAEETLDPDWFHAFIALAENIYSPEMQELWSKILAVEVSRPGSFSLKSLQTLRLLTKRDAQLFSSACRLTSRRAGDPVPRIILHYHQRKTLSRLFFSHRSDPINLANFGLSYPNILSLIDLGLLMPSEIESAEFPVGQTIQFRCGESTFSLAAKRSGVALSYYKFTNVGAELFLLAKKHEHPDYYQALQTTLAPVFAVRG